jgi:hypothetical protein
MENMSKEEIDRILDEGKARVDLVRQNNAKLARTLMIGNYVNSYSMNDYWQSVYTENAYVFHIENHSAIDNISTHSHKFEGIPLTEEWLIKFGFNKISSGNGYHLWDNGKLELNHKFEVSLFDGRPDDDDTKSFDISITSVHQLQNLYFNLIGEELKIKYP